MPSVYGRYPDACVLLSLDTEELAGLLLGYFRSLPWRQSPAVRRCIQRHVALYPDAALRPALAAALFAAWSWLNEEGLLDARAPALLSLAS